MKRLSKTLALIALIVPVAVLAQDSPAFIPLTNLPGIAEAGSSSSLPSFFNNLYKLCIGAAAVIAILQIMRAGTKFFFNKGSVAHNEEGKQLIQNSILGLLLVLSPAIVFGIINPDILELKLDVSGLHTNEPVRVGENTPLSLILKSTAWDDNAISESDLADPESVEQFRAYRAACQSSGGTSRVDRGGSVACPGESSGTTGCISGSLRCSNMPGAATSIIGGALCSIRYSERQARVGGQCNASQGFVSIDSASGCCAGITDEAFCCGKPTGTGLGVAVPTAPITVFVYKDRYGGGDLTVDAVYPGDDRTRYTAFRDGCNGGERITQTFREAEVRCPDQTTSCLRVRLECRTPGR